MPNLLHWSAKLMEDDWINKTAAFLRERGYKANVTGLNNVKTLNIWSADSVVPYEMWIHSNRGGGVVTEEEGADTLLAVMLLGKEFGLLLSDDEGNEVNPTRFKEGLPHLCFANTKFLDIERRAIEIGLTQPRLRLDQFTSTHSLLSL